MPMVLQSPLLQAAAQPLWALPTEGCPSGHHGLDQSIYGVQVDLGVTARSRQLTSLPRGQPPTERVAGKDQLGNRMTPLSIQCMFIREARNIPRDFKSRCPIHLLPRIGKKEHGKGVPGPHSACANSFNSAESMGREASGLPRLQMQRLKPREGTQLVNCRGRTGIQNFLASQQATALPLNCVLSL